MTHELRAVGRTTPDPDRFDYAEEAFRRVLVTPDMVGKTIEAYAQRVDCTCRDGYVQLSVKVAGKEWEPECKHHEGLAPGLVEARRAIDAARRLPRVSKPDLDGQGQRWDAMAPSTAHKIDFQKAIESIDLCDGPHGPRKPHNHSFGE